MEPGSDEDVCDKDNDGAMPETVELELRAVEDTCDDTCDENQDVVTVGTVEVALAETVDDGPFDVETGVPKGGA